MRVCSALMAAALGPVSDRDVLSRSLALPLRNFWALRHVCSCVWSSHEICPSWTLLTEVISVVSGWTRELLGWQGRIVRQHLSDGCHQHLDSTLSQILWWTRCRGLSFLIISLLFIWHFHCPWYGCFPQCFLFLVNAESIFLCLPVRQRFFQPSANAIFS